MNHDHPGNRRANTGAWARPASHKGYSAYSRETYKGAELDYRGRTPHPERPEEKPCDPHS